MVLVGIAKATREVQFQEPDTEVSTTKERAMSIRLSGSICALLAFALVLGCATNAFSQATSAEITGSVTDPTGAAIPGAEVRLIEASTNFTTALQTNAQGVYYMRLLSGTYTIEVKFQGFKTFTASNLRIVTGQRLRRDITLDLGDVAETVEVVAEVGAVTLQTDTAEYSTELPPQIVQGLPTITRKAWEMIDVSPGVRFNPGINSRGFNIGGWMPFLSIAGFPGPRSHNWYMDGSNSTFTRIQGDGGTMPAVNPPPELVADMRVIVNNYSAEFGGGGGGTITMSTKSGTNEFHGNLYHYFKNRSFNSRNFFAPDVLPQVFNLYGGSVGGPIIRDKTFFHVLIEFERDDKGGVRLLNVPSLLQRGGDFSQTFDGSGNLIEIYDPATSRANPAFDPSMPVTRDNLQFLRDQFPDNMIPNDRLDPVGVNLVDFFAVPNATGTITGAQNWRGTSKNFELRRHFQSYRVDHQFSERHRGFFGIIDDYTDPGQNGVFAGEPKARLADPDNIFYFLNSTIVRGGHTGVLSPTAISEFRFFYNHLRYRSRSLFDVPEVFGQGAAAQLGLTNVDPLTFPSFFISGMTNIGARGFAQEYAASFHTYGPTYTLNLIRGKHNIRVGGTQTTSEVINVFRQFPSGLFRFDARHTALPQIGSTGSGTADLMLGRLAETRLRDQISRDRRNWHVGAYIQDDWRVRDNLTLNIGFRYEYDSPPTDLTESTSFLDETRINPVCNCPGTITFSKDEFAVTQNHVAPHEDNKWNLAPRFGFAWEPAAGLVIRGGYGLVMPGIDYGNQFWLGPWHAATIIDVVRESDSLGLTNQGLLLREAWPLTDPPIFDDRFGAVPIGEVPIFDPLTYWQRRDLMYGQQMNLAVQKRVTTNMFLTVSYLGNLYRHVPSRLNRNELPPGALSDLAALNQATPLSASELAIQSRIRRPFPQFGNITTWGIPFNSSNYHAGIIQVTRNFSAGLVFTAHYTYAKHNDTLNYVRSWWNRDADYGPSSFDVRHRFIWAGSYELPFGPGKPYLGTGAAGKIFGDWSVTTRMEVQTGSPLTWGNAQNFCNCFTGGTQGVNVSGKPTVNDSGFDPAADNWFDTSVFSDPAPFTFGTAPVDTFGPGYWNIDTSLVKRITITERYQLDLRADFFNLLNHPNFNVPGTTFNSASFGLVSSTVDPGGNRKIQLALKLHF